MNVTVNPQRGGAVTAESLAYPGAGHWRDMTKTMQPKYRIIEPELGETTEIYRDGGRLVKPKNSDASKLVDVDCPPHYVVVTFDDEVVVEAWTTTHYAGAQEVFEASQTQEAYHYAQLVAHAENIDFNPDKSARITVINDR